MSFDQGLGTLTSQLASQLSGMVREQSWIERVEKVGERWRVHVADGSTTVADHIVFALPSHAAAAVVSTFDRELSAAMASIPYADLAVVALAYRAEAIGRPLDGYGYLVTRQENLSTLGVLWESSIFPNRAPGRLRAAARHAGRRAASRSERARRRRTGRTRRRRKCQQVLAASGEPLRRWIFRWPSAIAQYTVGHDARIATIRRLAAAHRGLHVCGTAYDGVSFNDAIASGRKTARGIVQELAA